MRNAGAEVSSHGREEVGEGVVGTVGQDVSDRLAHAGTWIATGHRKRGPGVAGRRLDVEPARPAGPGLHWA